MWAEKTIILIIEISTWHVFWRIEELLLLFFTLLTFNLSLTSQSSNIIPIFVSHIPSCRLTLPFLFFFFSSDWRKDSISCKESVYLVCVYVCVSWVQGEKRSRVQSSVIMECFNSLRCLYATSLSHSLSLFPSPNALPHYPSPPRRVHSGMSAFLTGPRGVCRPSHLSCSLALS